MSFGPFRVGDSPANDISVTIQDNDESDLSDYTLCDAILYDGTGTAVVSLGEVTIAEGGTATFPFPESPFATAGIYSLAPTIHGTTAHLQLDSIRFVVEVENPDGWHTLGSLRAQWSDAPWQDEVVFELLELAKGQVLAYAPVLVPNEDLSVTIPARYRKGQAMQARNLWTAAKVDPSNGQIGDDTFAVRPYPLDWVIKQILRPQNPLGWVG